MMKRQHHKRNVFVVTFTRPARSSSVLYVLSSISAHKRWSAFTLCRQRTGCSTSSSMPQTSEQINQLVPYMARNFLSACNCDLHLAGSIPISWRPRCLKASGEIFMLMLFTNGGFCRSKVNCNTFGFVFFLSLLLLSVVKFSTFNF